MPKYTDHHDHTTLNPHAARKLRERNATLTALNEAKRAKREARHDHELYAERMARAEAHEARGKRKPRTARKAPGQYTRLKPSRFPL